MYGVAFVHNWVAYLHLALGKDEKVEELGQEARHHGRSRRHVFCGFSFIFVVGFDAYLHPPSPRAGVDLVDLESWGRVRSVRWGLFVGWRLKSEEE